MAALASKKRGAALDLVHDRSRKLWPVLPEGITQGEPFFMHFNGILVLLSVMVAVVGAFASLTTSSYIRVVRNSAWYVVMVFQCGLGLGISTVWCMHFVGMRSVSLCSENLDTDTHLSPSFDLGLTLLSAILPWMFASLAIHVSMGQAANARLGLVRFPLSATLLSVGVGSMHYLGLLAERGQFIVHYNVGMVIFSAAVCFACCSAIIAIMAALPNSTAWRCAGALSVAILASTVHYVGMTPVSHHAHAVGVTWSLFPSQPVDVHAEATVIVSLFCDVLLMTGNAFYLEVIRVRDKHAVEKELEYSNFVQDARRVVKKSKVMQFPMALVRAHEFLQLGKLVSHEYLRDKKYLIMLDTPKAAAKLRRHGCIIFFSHQWLSSETPDPDGHQFHEMVRAIQALMRVKSLTIDNIFVWVDFGSIPQCSAEQQQLAINSLPAYVAASSAFIIVAPRVLHSDTNNLCSFATYSRRFWCRVEVFCAVLSAISHYHAEDSQRGFLATKSMMRTLSWDMEPDGNCKQRVYFAGSDGLQPLLFMDKDGMRDEYVDLLQVYEGQLDCCARLHRTRTGEEVPCDKLRVVQALTGLYGTMLVQLLWLRSQKRPGHHVQSLLRLGNMIVERQEDFFPSEYFGSRIEAVHEYVRNASKSRSNSGLESESPSIEADESLQISELVADLDGHALDLSSSSSRVSLNNANLEVEFDVLEAEEPEETVMSLHASDQAVCQMRDCVA